MSVYDYKISISNKLYIAGLNEEQKKPIKQVLTLSNPVYQTLLRRVKYGNQDHRCLYAVKKDFKYWEEDKKNRLIIGRGCYKRLSQYMDQIGADYSRRYDMVKKPLNTKFISTNLVLRDYQQGVASQIIRRKEGIIKCDTGWGKSLLMLKIIEKLQITALIIVPRLSILNQIKDEIRKYYNYEPGIIQGKIWNIKDITLASFATLKQRDFKEIKDKFSIIFCDECHQAISDKGINTIQQFNPRYLYGLTATADRSNGQGQAIQFVFGPIIVDQRLPQKKPQVQITKTNINIPVNFEYAEMITDMIENRNRNFLIYRLAIKEVKNKRKILILTKRIEHYKKIAAFFDNNTKIYQFSSDTDQKERDKLLTKLRNNEKDFDIILGTFSMLAIGVDIPRLDTLIIAGDLKSSILAQQSAGRILRLFKGKADSKIIDLDDNLNPILHKQALERKKFYKENNWEIC